jgi:hypothetical protein
MPLPQGRCAAALQKPIVRSVCKNAAPIFFGGAHWLDAQCEARWRGLSASYSLLTGCMVEVGYLRVPEGSIRVTQDSIRLHVNPRVIE